MKKVYFFVVLTAFLFGTMEVALKLAGSEMDSFQLTFLRFMIGGLLLLPFAIVEMRKNHVRLVLKDFAYLLYVGILGIPLSMLFFQLGVMHSNAATASVLISINPLFTMLFAHFMTDEKLKKKNVDAIDQRERRMEKMRLLLIHVVLLSVLLVGGSIGAKPVQAAEANPVDIENAQIIHKNDSYLAKVPKVQIDKISYKAGTDDVGTSDSDSMQQDLLSDLPLSDIQDVLQENTGTENIYFRELVKSLMLADANTDKQELFRQILRSAFGDVEEGRQVFVQILLLTAACAFLQNFINVFENSQISKTGFYLYFLLLMGLLLRSYLLIHGILEGVLDQVISFMEALLPAFCMTMVFCSQQVAAVGFYQLSLIVIYLIERVLLYVVIPAIHVYVVLQMLNCMTAGKLISRMTALLKRGLIWVMRLLLAGVTGMNVIERMIAPSVDNLKKMSVTQTISMIPGLGNTAQAVGNIFLAPRQ